MAASTASCIAVSASRRPQTSWVSSIRGDAQDRTMIAEPFAVGTSGASATAGKATTWTVTAQHVSAVLAAGKRTNADRAPVGGDTPGRSPKPSENHSSRTGSSSGTGAAQQHGDARSPPSAESVREPLLETRLEGRQQQGSTASLNVRTAAAPRPKHDTRTTQAEVPNAAHWSAGPAGTRVAGRRSTSDRPPGMRDAAPPYAVGSVSGYAGKHAAREAAAATAARAELEGVTAELETARGQLAEALRATQAERSRAQSEREAAAQDMEKERADHLARLAVRACLISGDIRQATCSVAAPLSSLPNLLIYESPASQQHCNTVAAQTLAGKSHEPKASEHETHCRRSGRQRFRRSPRSERSRRRPQRPLRSGTARWMLRWYHCAARCLLCAQWCCLLQETLLGARSLPGNVAAYAEPCRLTRHIWQHLRFRRHPTASLGCAWRHSALTAHEWAGRRRSSLTLARGLLPWSATWSAVTS